MILNNIKLFLLLVIASFVFSCKGQSQPKNVTTQNSVQTKLKLDKSIWRIFQDSKNHFWFGSNGKGLFHYDGKILKRYTTEDGLVDNTIRGIQEDHLGNVFIQSQNKGISKFDRSVKQGDGKMFTTLKPFIAPTNVWKLTPNDLWFISKGVVYRYDGEFLFELKLPTKDLKKAFGVEVKGLSFKDMNNSPYAVYGLNKDKAGNLWIGTVVAGAFRYDGKSFLWFPEKELSTLPDGRVPAVRSMLEDKDGYFWLSNFISKYKIYDNGTTAKYEKLEGIEKSFKAFKDRLPYFNSGVVGKNGDLWMTTYTGGVWKYDGEKLFNFPVDDGGKEVLLVSIFQDNQGIIWIGTDNAGVFKFDGKTFVKFDPAEK